MFSAHVHGASPNTKVFKYKSKITGGVTEFYAERGMVTIHGAHYKPSEFYAKGDEIYKRESVREFLLRALAFSAEVKHVKHRDERLELMRCAEMMVQVARTAQQQGDPLDPQQAHDLANRPNARSVFGPSGQRRTIAPAYFDPGVPPMPQADPNKPPVDIQFDRPPLIIPGR